jgi:hypothetical protein
MKDLLRALEIAPALPSNLASNSSLVESRKRPADSSLPAEEDVRRENKRLRV